MIELTISGRRILVRSGINTNFCRFAYHDHLKIDWHSFISLFDQRKQTLQYLLS
jgi:hypothetical protein